MRDRNPLYARYPVALLFVLVAMTACGGAPGSGSPSPAANGCGRTAVFILANPGGLTCLDDAARSIGKLTQLPDQSAPSTPTLHPSGNAIAFTLTQQPDPKRGFGSDIYMVDLDGTNLHPVVLHEDNNVFYASPKFDSSGNVLYVHRRAAIVQNGAYVGNEDAIERVDLRTGQATKIIKDGADPAVSPDGKMIVYIHLKDSLIDTVWRADVDGANAGPLLPGKDTFYYVQAPRFAPGGACELVFSAAGHSVSEVPGGPALVTTRSAGPSGPRLAHLSVPSDLYLVACDGSGLRSVGQTGDDVVPSWSPDGSKIAYVGSGGFFVLDVKAQTAHTVAQGQDFFFGDLIWLK